MYFVYDLMILCFFCDFYEFEVMLVNILLVILVEVMRNLLFLVKEVIVIFVL